MALAVADLITYDWSPKGSWVQEKKMKIKANIVTRIIAPLVKGVEFRSPLTEFKCK